MFGDIWAESHPVSISVFVVRIMFLMWSLAPKFVVLP